MKTILKHWPLIFISMLSLITSIPIFQSGYFTHHDDLQVMRIFEMRKCIEDLQIPCRWVPDLGYGNGFPLFNYYPVLPYYIGALFSYLFGFVGAAKVIFLIPLILAGFSMYILVKSIFEDKLIATVAATLYLLAPYRALDLYVRGAVAESFAIAIAPIIFYFSFKLIKKFSVNNFVWFSISLGLFLLCHNIMTIMFVPVLVIWIFLWLSYQKFKNWLPVLFSSLIGFGLSAFFTLPAFFEKELVQTESLLRGDLNYLVHFVTPKQMFLERVWGYGASFPGPNDTMSFQVGWPHWWLVTGLIVVAGATFLRKQKFSQQILLATLFILIFAVSIFMMYHRSNFIWETIPTLKFAQFPWRFLSITIFTTSVMGGLLLSFFNKNLRWYFGVVIIILTIALNILYFKPDRVYPLNDTQKLSGDLWREQQRASVLDYLPKTAVEPREPASEIPLILSGDAQINNFKKSTNQWELNIKVNEKAEVAIPVFDFPNWQVIVNDQNYQHSRDHIGRIKVNLEQGEYLIFGYFKNTLVRTVANTITIASVVSLMIVIMFSKRGIIWKK